MVKLVHGKSFDERFVGPLLDDGAPYSGIRSAEFTVLQPVLLPSWNGQLQSLPEELQSRPFWQYGSGGHFSESRRILGSVLLCAKSLNENLFSIRHLIIEGSSQWVAERIVMKLCNIEHIDDKKMLLPDRENYIDFVDHNLHSYIPYRSFLFGDTECLPPEISNKVFCAAAQIDHQKIPDRCQRQGR